MDRPYHVRPMYFAKCVALGAATFLLGCFTNHFLNEYMSQKSVQIMESNQCDYSLIIDQRNNISKLLNLKLQQLAQLTCTCMDAKTSGGGAYCPKQTAKGHITDHKLIVYLRQFFKGKRIGSFGDGPGQYKLALDNVTAVYDAYDGAPSTENFTKGRVQFLDLSVPQYSLPTYDYVMSLEVAEHIPREFEQTFLDNIARYANAGIVLSWAVPGQGGYEHVNNRPLTYVMGQLMKRGFIRDDTVSKQMQQACSLAWLKRNVNFYSRFAK